MNSTLLILILLIIIAFIYIANSRTIVVEKKQSIKSGSFSHLKSMIHDFQSLPRV
jgi:hypothetical protein